MLRNILQRVGGVKQYIRSSLKRSNIFERKEERVYSDDQITKAMRFALASNAADYKNFAQVEGRLSAIIFYLVRGERLQAAEELLSLEEEAFWMTPKYVLYMFQKYLERVMPTNITYYHFVREKELYTQYVAIKYILVVGLHHPHLFHKMKTSQRVYIFTLLLEWLLAFVYYRCSAIYIASDCADPLIFQAHLLLSALLGFGGNSILSSLTEEVVSDVANKLLYIEGFLLSMAIPTKNYLSMQVVLSTLRKLLTSVAQQRIVMYLPSYLYANLIGYVKTPYTTHIIYRLLAFFLAQNKPSKGSHESAQAIEAEDCSMPRLVTECWSLLALLADEYELDKSVSRDLVVDGIEGLDNRSINRAFVLRVAEAQHLELEEEKIAEYARRHKQPFVVSDKVMAPGVVAKNYHIVMEHEYCLGIISQAARGRWQKIEMSRLWEQATLYNKYEIASMDDYLAQLRAFQKST